MFFKFFTLSTEVYKLDMGDEVLNSRVTGHGGADFLTVDAFIKAVEVRKKIPLKMLKIWAFLHFFKTVIFFLLNYNGTARQLQTIMVKGPRSSVKVTTE